MSEATGPKGKRLRVNGIVQGVGFRPYVYRLATHWQLVGWVLNAHDGVHIHIEGSEDALTGFVSELRGCAPAAALINDIVIEDASPEGFGEFTIRPSAETDAGQRTLVSADIASCPQCLDELFDSKDRRYHYPFINCTNCGPRFTIIESLPYDRPNTSMAGFKMCGSCSHEYHQPLDRRFHAQPDACFDCGPALTLWQDGESVTAAGPEASDGLIARVAALLSAGKIVAMKGLGGYQLACDAGNQQAVERLRQRKRRSAKPFALMLPSLDAARSLCLVDELEAELLSGMLRPIVLLRRRDLGGDGGLRGDGFNIGVDAGSSDGLGGDGGLRIADAVAGSLHELGIMLPYTPLQHLLMAEVQGPLVMTSGNVSEEPIAAGEAEAHQRLAGIADAFLDNNRDILSRYDDSVMRVVDGECQVIRRARGLAPRPVAFPELAPGAAAWDSVAEQGVVAAEQGVVAAAEQDRVLPGGGAAARNSRSLPLLAVGAEQKNTFCLADGREAFVSQHIGDLENADCFDFWQSTLALYQRLFKIDYQVIACDKHPDYLASKWARRQGEAPLMERRLEHPAAASGQSDARTFIGAPLEVQHHHAHIAAVLAENLGGRQSADTPVIGLAFDGTGFGDDGSIWGGELLIASLASSQRLGCLLPVCLPGGSAAIRHPSRMAWSYLYSLGLSEHPAAAGLTAVLGGDRPVLEKIISGRVNSPLSSSMGRLFDAVSALLGICQSADYEGQPAVELEAALYDRSTGMPLVDTAASTEVAKRYSFRIIDNTPPGHCDNGLPRSLSLARNDGSISEGMAKSQGDGICHFDPSPVLRAILDDQDAGLPVALISLRFHDAVVRLMVEACSLAHVQSKLATVALGGGVFMNRYLLSQAKVALTAAGFAVLLNRELPPNDGCISYGQAAVAAASLGNRHFPSRKAGFSIGCLRT